MVIEFSVNSAGIAGDPYKLMYAHVCIGDKKIEEHTMFNSSPIFFKEWHYRRAQRRLIKQIKKQIQKL